MARHGRATQQRRRRERDEGSGKNDGWSWCAFPLLSSFLNTGDGVLTSAINSSGRDTLQTMRDTEVLLSAPVRRAGLPVAHTPWRPRSDVDKTRSRARRHGRWPCTPAHWSGIARCPR